MAEFPGRENDAEKKAKTRFWTLQLLRFSAVGMVFGGAYLAYGEGAADGGAMSLIGKLLLVLGAADFFFAPILLRKLWEKIDK